MLITRLKSMKMDFNNLCIDIIAVILSYIHLPHKYSRVCKKWKRAIHSKTFERFWKFKVILHNLMLPQEYVKIKETIIPYNCFTISEGIITLYKYGKIVSTGNCTHDKRLLYINASEVKFNISFDGYTLTHIGIKNNK